MDDGRVDGGALGALSPVMGAVVERGVDFARRHEHLVSGGHGALPIDPWLSRSLGESGPRRGMVHRCDGDAAVSLLWALIAPASREGSWIAAVDMAGLGMMAAREHGVALHRLVNIDTGGDASLWHRVVGNCVDGMDIVVVGDARCSPTDARRIRARMRSSGSVLFIMGDPGSFSPEVSFTTTTTRWRFSTRAIDRHVRVSVSGRHGHRWRSCDITMGSRARS